MRAYPLIRRKWSNEHVLAALFSVILLYLIPVWLKNPVELPSFLAALALSLLIDALAGFLRHKQLVCAVSAAVTAGILQVITPGVPLWVRLIGAAAAIIAGKQVWGGMGKNPLNPAILGYLVISILFKASYMPIEPSMLLIPALLLSLPFVLYRPFVSTGYIAGAMLAVLTGDLSFSLILLVNCMFFGCVVITDPVTVTPLKTVGMAGGFFTAFLSLRTGNPMQFMALYILLFNAVSYLIEDFSYNPRKRLIYFPPVIKSAVKEFDFGQPALDFTGKDGSYTAAGKVLDAVYMNGKVNRTGTCNDTGTDTVSSGSGLNPQNQVEPEPITAPLSDLTPETILDRISRNDVYGCGGAAFPTIEKIKAVISSNAAKKYFIINGVECDPGLIHDKWLLHNRAKDIYKGIKAVCSCLSFTDVILAVKNTDGLAFPDDIKLQRVKDFYPAGFEKILIESILRKKFSGNSIPSMSGILVLNIQTIISIYEAVYHNKKTAEKYITISDMKTGSARTAKVKIGSSIMSVSETVYPGRHPVFTGGGVMQAHMADDFDIIEKGTNFITISKLPRYKESSLCSKCGICTSNCPQGLLANRIASLVDEERYDEAVKYRPDKCISCGTCSYVCPGGRNLSARVREAKVRIGGPSGLMEEGLKS